MTDLTNDLRRRMDGAIKTLQGDFSGLRTGRASASLLDTITVEVYGSQMPLNQVGSVSVPEPHLLTVSVWDKANAKAVEKAIQQANLGLNPAADGTLIRVPIPPLSQERRQELVKIAGKFAEQAKVAIRNVRRDGMDAIKKDGDLSKDEQQRQSDAVQKVTDEYVKKVDDLFAAKEKEILAI